MDEVESILDHAAAAGRSVISTTSVDEWAHILSCQHEIARCAAPMIECGARTAADRGDEPLARYLRHHAEEERGHDVWVREDLTELERLGASPDGPDATVKPLRDLLLQQRKWLSIGHALPLLGHMWAIESRPPSIALVRGMLERLGLTDSCARTHLRHAIIDPSHAADLKVQIERYSGCPDAMLAISAGARCTALGITRFWLAVHSLRPAIGEGAE